MLRVLTDEEVKTDELRCSFLYGSAFTIDNLTAILMDSSKGGFGMYEAAARAKAHEVVAWLETITGVQIPDQNQPSPTTHPERMMRK